MLTTLDRINQGDWILTVSGRRFWPLDPRPEDVHIEEIAHALSQICRFTGHTTAFYSVAQHCLLASWYVEERHALRALLHDASEAYIADVSRPVKHAPVMAGYRAAEDRLQAVIEARFGVQPNHFGSAAVKRIDQMLCVTERRQLCRPPDGYNGGRDADDLTTSGLTIVPMMPQHAKAVYLDRFRQLTS